MWFCMAGLTSRVFFYIEREVELLNFSKWTSDTQKEAKQTAKSTKLLKWTKSFHYSLAAWTSSFLWQDNYVSVIRTDEKNRGLFQNRFQGFKSSEKKHPTTNNVRSFWHQLFFQHLVLSSFTTGVFHVPPKLLNFQLAFKIAFCWKFLK